MKKRIASSAVLLVTAFFWGVSFVAQVLGARYMDTSTFNAARFLLGALVLVPVCLLIERDHPDRKKIRKTALAALCSGAVMFLASYLQQLGTGLVANPGKSGFITGIYTVLTPVFYFLFFRRKSGAQIWVGAVLAAVGLYLLCFDGTSSFVFGKGELILLSGTVFWAWHIIVVDRFVEDVSPLKFACGQFFVCGMLNLFVAFATGHPTWQAISDGKWAILFCGIFSTGIGFTAQVIGQKMMQDPSRSAILLSTESLFSALGGLAWNLFPIANDLRVDASMNIYGIIGCAVIFLAIILAQLPSRKEIRIPVAQK